MRKISYKIGDEFETKTSGKVRIVEIENSSKITVEFIDTLYRKIVQSGKLKAGNIKDDSAVNYYVGKVFVNKFGQEYEITRIINAAEIEIEFKETGYTTWIQSNKLVSGSIRDRESAFVYGFGINDLPNLVQGTEDYQCYRNWSWILNRCFSESYKKREPNYINFKVSEHWARLSTFQKWWKLNYVEGWNLDKDVLGKGEEKIYSPETCCFIPTYINSAFTRLVSKSKYALGVGKSRNPRLSPYEAILLEGGTRCFQTIEEAHKCWQLSKIKHCHGLIQRYKNEDKWRQDVVDSMINKINQIEEDYRNNQITKILDW